MMFNFALELKTRISLSFFWPRLFIFGSIYGYGVFITSKVSTVQYDLNIIFLGHIQRDFKNAPFYILCLFHMIHLRVFSLSCFILMQNGP